MILSTGRCSRRWLVSISYRYSYHDDAAEHCHVKARWRTASGKRFAHVPYAHYAQACLRDVKKSPAPHDERISKHRLSPSCGCCPQQAGLSYLQRKESLTLLFLSCNPAPYLDGEVACCAGLRVRTLAKTSTAIASRPNKRPRGRCGGTSWPSAWTTLWLQHSAAGHS